MESYDEGIGWIGGRLGVPSIFLVGVNIIWAVILGNIATERSIQGGMYDRSAVWTELCHYLFCLVSECKVRGMRGKDWLIGGERIVRSMHGWVRPVRSLMSPSHTYCARYFWKKSLILDFNVTCNVTENGRSMSLIAFSEYLCIINSVVFSAFSGEMW